VTAIDIWCCQWLTVETELNPLARYILSNYDVWTLVSLKVVGTFICTEWLRNLHIYFSIVVSIVMFILILILIGIIPAWAI
jgi:hypothetical protein